MYQLVSTFLKDNRNSSHYQNIDIRKMKVGEVLDKFIDGYIELSSNFLSRNIYTDINELRRSQVNINTSMTFEQWLGFIEHNTLPGSPVKPKYQISTVYARDAILAGFKVSMIEPNKLPNEGGAVSNKTNLYIHGSNDVSNESLVGYTLVSVNGMLHPCNGMEDGLQVIGGGKTWLHAKKNNVSLINFKNIGKVRQIPLTEDNIKHYTSSTPYATCFMISLGENITGKSIILSLGGYMFVNPSFATVVAPEKGLIKVNLSAVDVPFKVLHSYQLIDLSSLGVVSYGEDDGDFGKLRVDQVKEDVVVKKWLTLPQSFVVVVDTITLTMEKIPLQQTGIYGAFEYHENPYLPLQDHYGRLQDYWVKHQNQAWIVQIDSPVYKPLLATTVNSNQVSFITKATQLHGVYKDPPYLLKIMATNKGKS